MIKLLNLLYEGADAPITQRFGNVLIINGVDVYAQYNLKGHNGVDFGIPTGTKLYSCIDGTVIEAQADPTGYGNYIKIENEDCGVLYAHLKSFGVAVGEVVKAGQVIGISDNTGNSTGSHLHFGVFPKPRDRGNGYNGYIDPFNHNLVEWVDDIANVSPDEEIATLKLTLSNLQVRYDGVKADKDQLVKDNLIKADRLRAIVKEIEGVIS